MVALDKGTGSVVWTSMAANGGTAFYSSITIAEVGGIRQYVAFLQDGLIGIDANTGTALWRDDRMAKACGGAFPTPIFHQDHVYSACNATGGALVRLRVDNGKVVAEPIYHERRLPAEKGGFVLIGGHLYGTNSQALTCFEFATGMIKWRERGVGAASVAYADGRLYVRGESGEVALVDPTPDGYREKGRFTPPRIPDRGKSPVGWPAIAAFPHPVIANGRLYLRDVGTLWSYDISARR
jgi:outer membrane protein assembly factor BamB